MLEWNVKERAVEAEKRLVDGSELSSHIAPIKYRWAWEAYLIAQRNFWLPTEIGMGEDLLALRKLSEDERHTFFTTFATLTTADALHQRNLALAVYERITAPEVGMAVIAQMHQETIHSMSYQHIIESLHFEEDEIYLLYQKVPEIRAKFEYSNAITRGLQDRKGTLRDYAKGLFFYYMVFEGIWFMAGFCPIFSLQRRRLMVRTGEQLQYIARDECLVGDVEVLTPEGWVKAKEVTEETVLAQWHPEGYLSWTRPLKVTTFLADGYYEFDLKSLGFYQRVSENHRFPYLTKHGALQVVPAWKATPNPDSVHPMAAPLAHLKPFEDGETDVLVSPVGSLLREKLSPLEAFLIALQADGALSKRSPAKFSGHVPARFSLKKACQIERLREILTLLGWKWKEKSDTQDRLGITVEVPVAIASSNRFRDWVRLDEVSLGWCREFIEEIVFWNGHVCEEGKRYLWTSTSKEDVDLVQAVATLCGYRTRLTVVEERREESFWTCYHLFIHKYQNSVRGGRINKRWVPEPVQMVGIQVPSSFLVIRDEGCVSVTGNSGHVAFGKSLISALWEEHPETRLSETEAHRIIEEAMALEEDYARYAVKPMLGYHLGIHLRHVRYLANRRLSELGFAPLYTEAECLPWWEEQVGFRKEKNFFETRVTDYQVGGALRWDDEP